MSLQILIDELKEEIEQGILFKLNKIKKPINKEVLYNIHKRSLPVGFDRPIAFNMSERDATILSKHLTRMIKKHNKYDEIKYYFDIIR